MGTDKCYDGYDSYDYLDDHEQFDRPGLFSGFEPHEVALTDEEKSRLADVLENTVVSLHDHPFFFPEDVHADIWDWIHANRVETAYEYLSQTPLDAVFDMHLDGLSGVHSKNGWKWDDIVSDVTMRACDVAHSEYVFRVGDVVDIRRAHEEGKLGIIPALESAAPIENELDRIEQLYGMGIRSLGVTYSASNALGTGQGGIHKRDGGLTAFGAEAIRRMNDVGMAVSTSHSSTQTTLDVCDVTDKPVFDTHALAQEAGVSARGVPDEEIETIAATGGVVGILSSTHLPDLETYMEHFEYMVDLVGIDHVTFGPDVLYGDHTSLLEVLAETSGIELPESTMQNPYVEGLENPTEAWNNIPRWLVREGYSDRDIEKVLGSNVLRVLSKVW